MMNLESFSIESGYFVFTMMPSLRCSLNCPHCYLSKEQRRSKDILSVENLGMACGKVADYYRMRGLKQKTIVCYWYGGEPTEMGQEYFESAVAAIGDAFPARDGYTVKHTVLSSLINIDPSWHALFHKHCGGEIQTSFDWTMRGAGYVRHWERSVRGARLDGLRVSTISVVNREILEFGPEQVLDYLTDHGVAETSWLPFMWNEQNDGGAYTRFAPTMRAYSEFMSRLTLHWLKLRATGANPPEIGQMRFILAQQAKGGLANIAGQTLFLLPNGDFVLPDYRNGCQEFMQPFGNILSQDFADVLSSPARRAYLRKQVLRNGNADCGSCDHGGHCLMEFWKENRNGDDCFGAKGYVEWLQAERDRLPGDVLNQSRLY